MKVDYSLAFISYIDYVDFMWLLPFISTWIQHGGGESNDV